MYFVKVYYKDLPHTFWRQVNLGFSRYNQYLFNPYNI